VNDALHAQAETVLALLAHAQNVFGADRPPADPPAFAAPPDLEQRLGNRF
jgi:hypothetical protein